jgi:ribosome recycling factor
MSEEDVALVLGEAREAMEKSIRSFRIDLQKVRTGRANPAILDGVLVDYYGSPTPLNQLASLGAPDPRLIVISPYDRGALPEIERAILKSDLGLTPNNDGKLLRIPIPSLTEERRRDLVKQIRKSAEHHRVGVREARRAAVALLKELEADGSVPADERRRTEKAIQDLTDESVAKLDGMTDQKEEEILQV